MPAERSPNERFERLVDRVRVIGDAAGREQLFAELAHAREPCVVSFVNAHGMNLACSDEAFFDALIGSDVLLRDGSGMRLLYAALGRDPGLNMNGTDFIPQLLARFADAPIALCGSQEPYLARAAESLHARVVLRMDGFRDDEAYAPEVAASGARIVVLAMGMPKQERVARCLKAHLERGVIVINGGAIVDFAAGRFPRAPRWMRWVGLEWTYRLLREPRRLASRYLVGNLLFLWRIASLRLRRSA